ncbi:MAG: NrdJb [Arhodomonas sp.]|nr:NrdJb [Arhodomonas sp.]
MTHRIDRKIVGLPRRRGRDEAATPHERGGRDRARASRCSMHEELRAPGSACRAPPTRSRRRCPSTRCTSPSTTSCSTRAPSTRSRRPFEIFINSKNMDHFQWIVALTRIISAVFRKGGDCTFLVEELHSRVRPAWRLLQARGQVHALAGGRDRRRHRAAPQARSACSSPKSWTSTSRPFIEQKRAEYEAPQAGQTRPRRTPTTAPTFPEGAQLCGKCHTKAMVVMDGCLTCLNCGDSKCG